MFSNESFIHIFEGFTEFYMIHISKFCINIFEDVEKYFSWTDNSSKLDIKCTKLLNGNYMENINGNTSYFTFQDQKHTGHVLILCSSNSSFFSQVQRQKDLDFSFLNQRKKDPLFLVWNYSFFWCSDEGVYQISESYWTFQQKLNYSIDGRMN